MLNTSKKCSKCKQTKSLSEFHKDKYTKSGFKCSCKKCSKIYTDINLKKRQAYSKEYYKNKKNKKIEYLEKNKEILTIKRKIYNAKNKESIKIKKRLYSVKNKEKIAASKKKSYEKNKESIKNKAKTYYKNNKASMIECNKKYYSTEKGIISKRNSYHKRRSLKISTFDNSLPIEVRYPLTEELSDLLIKQGYKCNICGCDITKKKHLDHHIPLSKGGAHSIDNVVWLCPHCNLSKGSNIPNNLLLI